MNQTGRRCRHVRSVTLLLLALWSSAACRQPDADALTLATTTSAHDSGLLDAILPDFETQYDAKVEVVAVGTGQAFAIGEAGDADLLLVHARQKEEEFVAEGHGAYRRDVMYNDFVILGAAVDPAGVAGKSDVAAALKQIAATESPFISRGDESGTHIREQMLWADAGIQPAGDWYQSVGQGMGATLTIASEQGAYTLTDRGTFLARQGGGFALIALVEGDSRLFNQYGIIPINPAVHPQVNDELAQLFIDWITSPPVQQAIGEFKINGQTLFVPNANLSSAVNKQPEGQNGTDSLLIGSLFQALRLIAGGNQNLWEIVWLSIGVSGTALIIAGILGAPLGAWLGLRRFRGQNWLTALIYTGMGFPPVVIGLFVYLLLSQQGVLSGLNWLFTPAGMIVAQIILAFPLVTGVTMGAVRGVNPELRQQLQALGASQRQITTAILGEARYGVLVGLAAGFGAAISEVGAVMLVGGNIAGSTRVLTTAIVLETRQGNFDLALALGIILLILAFVANVIVVQLQGVKK